VRGGIWVHNIVSMDVDKKTVAAMLSATVGLFSLLALSAPAASGQTSSAAFELSTRAGTGLLYGSASEFVYNQDVAANYKNSELFWPFQPLYYSGATLSLESNLGLFANLEVKQGFSGKTGTMSDSDFLNGDGVRTHLSESDSYTERALLLDLTLGYDIPLLPKLSIGAYGGFSYMDFKWSARDGYYQYPAGGAQYYFGASGQLVSGSYAPWSESETKTPLYGTGILYEQAYLVGLAGLRASFQLLDALSLKASLSLSPLAWCYTEDNHEDRSVDFYAALSGGLMIEPSLALVYAIRPGASLELRAAYRSLYHLVGDITQINQGATSISSTGGYYAGPDSASTSAKGAGAAVSMFDLGLGFRLSF
jgi:outer membrane protease